MLDAECMVDVLVKWEQTEARHMLLNHAHTHMVRTIVPRKRQRMESLSDRGIETKSRRSGRGIWPHLHGLQQQQQNRLSSQSGTM